MIRMLRSRCVKTVTRTRPFGSMPIVMYLLSSAASGSSIVIECGFSRATAASAKSTPCFRAFESALRESHSTVASRDCMYICAPLSTNERGHPRNRDVEQPFRQPGVLEKGWFGSACEASGESGEFTDLCVRWRTRYMSYCAGAEGGFRLLRRECPVEFGHQIAPLLVVAGNRPAQVAPAPVEIEVAQRDELARGVADVPALHESQV